MIPQERVFSEKHMERKLRKAAFGGAHMAASSAVSKSVIPSSGNTKPILNQCETNAKLLLIKTSQILSQT